MLRLTCDGIMDPIEALITNYYELNSSAIDELPEEPSPLEFMRFVARNRPFVVRGAAAEWKAVRTWSAAFLDHHLRDHSVNVAVTPDGNADAPTTLNEDGGGGGGTLVFAKPLEEDQPFSEFLRHVVEQESSPKSETRYAQTQNDNLRHEYISLFNYVQPDIPFARIALQRLPEAINLWIGNSGSVTALHRDNYENIYVQVAGQKHFVLLPPLCQPCVHEQALRPATYLRRDQHHAPLHPGGPLRLALEADAEPVPFPTWDPDTPLGSRATKYSRLARPMRLTLGPGDMLYLPCMWYHKVSQSASDEGICVAVNYWYDMDFDGPLYPLTGFVAAVSESTRGTMSSSLR